jgi:hypothetical protein
MVCVKNNQEAGLKSPISNQINLVQKIQVVYKWGRGRRGWDNCIIQRDG